VLEVVPIQNKRQWYEYLQVARATLDEVREELPSWTLISVIGARLDAMEAAVAEGRTPTREDRERALALGVLAVRSLDQSIPEYSKLLKELAAAFECWAELPDAAPPEPGQNERDASDESGPGGVERG